VEDITLIDEVEIEDTLSLLVSTSLALSLPFLLQNGMIVARVSIEADTRYSSSGRSRQAGMAGVYITRAIAIGKPQSKQRTRGMKSKVLHFLSRSSIIIRKAINKL